MSKMLLGWEQWRPWRAASSVACNVTRLRRPHGKRIAVAQSGGHTTSDDYSSTCLNVVNLRRRQLLTRRAFITLPHLFCHCESSVSKPCVAQKRRTFLICFSSFRCQAWRKEKKKNWCQIPFISYVESKEKAGRNGCIKSNFACAKHLRDYLHNLRDCSVPLLHYGSAVSILVCLLYHHHHDHHRLKRNMRWLPLPAAFSFVVCVLCVVRRERVSTVFTKGERSRVCGSLCTWLLPALNC